MGESEKILETLISTLSQGIHIVDSEGKTIYYNSAMERIEGVKRSEVLGKKVSEISNIEERSSTLMNSLKYRKKFTDVIQKYNVFYGKDVTTINTTVPVYNNKEIIAAIEIAKDMTQLKELSDKINALQNINNKEVKGYRFNDIITNNKAMLNLIEKAKKASNSKASVLITGETGSGKELFAQSIHYDGIRRDKPFVAINCAAIPSSLLESTLFGTVKGSFTGAEDKQGLFSKAQGGTVFLDEISSMDTYLQSKLLRVLQEGFLRPVGSEEEIEVDIRVIAALNEDPEKLMMEGKLRKDLFYRLSVVKIDVPPLRERKEDIPTLIKYFIYQYNKSFGRDIKSIDETSIKKLLNYNFPGNIRELRNIIESACIMSEEKNNIVIDPINNDTNNINVELKEFKNISLQSYLESIEKSIIEKILIKNDYNISKSSKELQVSRQNLQYKIKKYYL
ncbi:arginine utilization regulatory protein [Clostridium amylolyticum]|uniref:Arginine utilization regulatory protein n=1 Tax=Clostridium amylolyticum TaxID=1121298 RepID=A0A1M6CXA9_9CLOT|nr:sigma 54-interacting transcriptional regulator [Clostridium amylolyticum]SHI65523.1 arginine utilization regulatory protein [Clostridium amylolyticum]